MITVQNIIDEIRSRADTDNISDNELIEYINDADAQFMESLFPVYSSVQIPFVEDQYTYDLSASTSTDKIEKVYIDDEVITKRRSANDIMDGWYASGTNIVLTDDYVDGGATGMTVVYRRDSIPHLLEDAATDADLAIPDAYNNLYVFHALAQIASKEAETTAYQNYKNEYNTLLAEALTIVTKNQLSPKYKIT